jgi:hypothetical protein
MGWIRLGWIRLGSTMLLLEAKCVDASIFTSIAAWRNQELRDDAPLDDAEAEVFAIQGRSAARELVGEMRDHPRNVTPHIKQGRLRSAGHGRAFVAREQP